jgi:hypothetical protein
VIREVTGAVPHRRGRAAPVLPRWIADPHAADFASRERLAAEARAGAGLTGWLRPLGRFMHALDLVYGKDRAPAGVVKPPRWPGEWAPWLGDFDPASFKVLPGAPPDDLRQQVEQYQAAADELVRHALEKSAAFCPVTGKLRELGIPPELSGAYDSGL